MGIAISFKNQRNYNMIFLKFLILSSLLLGFINHSSSGQCTVTGVSGSGFDYADFCAPAYAMLYYEFTFGEVAPPETQYRVLWIWGDGSPITNDWCPVRTKIVGSRTVYYVRSERDHTFPAVGNCEYHVNITLVDQGYQCPDSRQVQIISNWHQDDVASANGIISFNPTPRHDVCIGLPLNDFRFSDATNFACNLQDNPNAQKPNHTSRHQQYVYGTNPVAGRGIPNLFIKVGTAQTLVRLTDVNGNSVPNSWTVNPVTGATVPAYSTVSGYFEGPVVEIPVDGATGTYTLPQTYPILFDGVGTEYQDQFQVTLRNWNVCNPWNGSQTNPNAGNANSATTLIYIVNGPIAEAGNPFNICANGSATMSGQIQRLATAGYWSTKEGDGSFTNANRPSGAIYTPGPNDIVRGSVWLYLTATSPTAPCNSHQDSVQVTIIPAITNNTVSAPQTLCYGSIPANLTGTIPGGGNGTYAYLWERSTTSAVTGFSAAPGTNTLQNYTVSGAHTVTTWYRRRVTSGPCVHTSSALQITVRPTPKATISGTRTVCQGATQPNVTFSNPQSIPITVTYNINGSGLFTRNVSANGSATVSVPTGTPGSYTYNLVSVRYRDDAPGCSAGVTGSATITVRPTPTVSISGATTVCRGGPSPYITFTNPQDIDIRVFYRRNSTNYGITVSASSTATVAVPTNSAGTFTYTILYVRYLDDKPGCNNNNISASVDVIVRETPSASIGGTTTVCQNGTAPNITFSNPRPLPITVTYNINGSGSYTRAVPANGTATVSVPTGTAGTYTYNLVSARYQNDDPGCPASITGSATVTVRPTPTATISGSTSVCQNASSPDVTFTNPQSLPVTVTYNINGSGSYTINIPASSTATITAPTGTAGIFAYNLVSVVYQNNPTCSNSISGTATITVTASPAPSITGPNDVCAGVTGVIYSTPYVAGNNYSWAISGGVITSGENTNSITVTWGAAGSGWLRVTETNGVPCSTTTPNYVVTINPGAPAAAPSIVAAVTDICKNGDLFVDVTNVATANQYIWDFSWVAGTNNATTAISEISIDLTGVPVGTYTVSVQASNGCGTGPWMAPRSFDINDIPDLSPLGATVCSDVATGITLAIENAGTYCSGITYNIIEINNGGLSASAGSPIAGNGLTADVISDDAWTNTSGINANVIYTVVPVSSQSCSGAAEDINVTVQSEPEGEDTDLEICSGTTLGYNIQTQNINILGNGQLSTFTWAAEENASVSGETTSTQTTGIINDSLINVSGTNQTVNYTVTPTGSLNSCPGNSFKVSVTVKSQPVGWNAATSICSNVALSYNLQTSVINVAPGNSQESNFSWVATDNPNVTGESTTAKSGNAINDVLRNVTGSDQEVVYNVTPTGTNGCAGNSFTVTVTVKSEPVGGVGTTNICSDNALSYNLQTANIDVYGNGQASTFSWIAANNPNVTGESTTAQSGGIINDNINNVSGVNQNVVYTVTPTGTNNCVGAPFQVTATIRSEPEGAHDDLIICSGEALNYDIQVSNINALGNGQASTFSWVAAANFNVGGESTSAQTTGTITDVLTNKTSTNQVVIYTVTPTGSGTDGCPGNSFTIFVTVKPEPVITNGQNVTICSGNQMNYEILLDNFTDPASDGVTFTWDAPVLDPSGNPLFTGGSMRDVASSANITDIFTNTLGGLATATYIITPYINGCAGDPDTLIVTVGAEPILDNLDKFVCSGQPVELTLKEAAGSVEPSHYNIAKRILSPGLTVSAPADTAVLPKTDALAGYLFNDRYINTTGVNQTVTYSVQPVLAPDCFGAFVDVVVTIRPAVIAGALGGDAEICAGEDAPVIYSSVAASGGDGTITYSWYYTEDLSADPGDPGWILISGENGLSYNPGVLTTSTKFTRRAMDGSCPDEAYSNAVTITVNPLPVTSEISGPALLCVGAVNQVYSVVNTPGSTYTWTLPDSLRLGSPQGLNFIIVEAIGTTLPGDKITVTETLSSTTQCVGIPVELPIVISPKVPGDVVTGPLDVCVGDSGVIYSVPYNENSSYSWNIPAGAYITSEPDSNRIAVTFNMALSGQISVIETSQSVCTTVHVPVPVTVHALPNVYNVSATQFYCFGIDGVTVSLSGSQSGVNYQLLKNGSPEGGIIGGTGSVLTWSNMTAGIYTVSATNAAPPNCTRMMNGTITVQENPQILISDIAVTQPKCYGGSDGTIVITASGGFPPVSTLTYSIDGGMTFVASNTFNVAAGTYNVVVKDIMNCTATAAPVTIGQPTELVISSVDVTTPVTCYGFSTGSVRVTASGGTLNFSYEWYSDASFSSPIGQTTAEATGLPAGTYYVRVTDANGCFKTGSVVLAQPAQITATAAITSNFNGAHISCNGANNAEITVSASGGTGILSYVLDQDPSNVTGSGSGVFTGVGPGTYTITVTDANLCTQVTNSVVVTEPLVITASAEVTSDYNGSDIRCNGESNGRITVTASGGTGALSYAINEIPGNLTGLNTGIFTGVPAGSYNITVTDKNSCTTVVPVTITEPDAVGISASVTSNYNGSQISCSGSSDGEITAIGSGGTGTLSYLLVQLPGNQTGATTGIFTGLPAGTYNVRVTDVNGCTITTPNIVITNPPALTISGSVTSNYNGSQISCFGEADGVITVISSGGTGAVTYMLDQDPSNVSGSSSGVFTGLAAGTYTVTVTDENSCTKTTGNITISNPAAITASALITSNYNGSHVSCNGASNGEITVTSTGGTGALTYLLIEMPGNITGASSGVFTDLPAGTYTVTVTDENDCATTTVPVTIIDPPAITASAEVTSNYNGSQISCNGVSDGRITVTASGGTGALRYAINEIPGNLTGLNTGIFTGVPAGSYNITVTDKNSCTTVVPVTITEPDAVGISASVTSNYNGSQISCSGSSDGEITAIGSGGTGTLSYLLVQLPGNQTGATTGIFTGLPAGTYNVRVTDVNGCTITTPNIVITNPPALTISGSVTSNYNGSQISCFGEADGVITVISSGGTGAVTYMLDQDPSNVSGSSSGVFTGLAAGTYTVTVTDENSCTKTTGNITISNPAAITASALITSNYNGSHVSCNGASNGEITVTSTGGTGALTYLLIEMPGNITGASSGVFTDLPAGTYTVTVTDENDCATTTVPVTIIDPPAITASAEVTSNYNGSQISCNGASDGRLTVTASGGTGILSYSLVEMPANVSGQITGVFTNLPAGTYTVQVSDKNSCNTYTTPVTISAPSAVTVNASVTSNYNGSDLSCYGSSDGVITALASGGTGALSYSIVQMPGNLTGTVSGVFTGVPAGTYTIRVTDANACYGISAEVIVDNPDIITATGSVTSNYFGSQISCFGAADGEITITANGGTGTLSFVLDQDPSNVSGSSSGVFTGLVAGNYTVTVTDLNGCTTKTPVIIVSSPSNIVAVASVTSNYNGSHISCNGVSDGEITVIATGGTGTLNFVLDQMPGNTTGATSGIFTGLPAGSYTVTVSDVNFCNVQTVPVNVNEPSVITATAAVTSNYYGSQISCNGASDGRITVTASGGTGNLSYALLEIPGNTSGAITGVFTGLPAGSYTFIVTDQNGCNITTDPVTISEPPALTLTINVTSNYNGRDISCFGASDGRIQAVVGGGTGVYFYSWYSDAAMTIPIGQLTPDAINLAAGDYYVKVMDINGCTITGGITLMQPVALNAIITSQTNILCYGNSTGSLTVEAVAGTGTPPYLYSYNGGADWETSGTFNSLAAATYVILVRDANDCIKQVPVTISQPSQLTASVGSITNVSCNGGNNGIITVTATAGSGTAPYTYSIDGGSTWQADGTFSGLTAGSYNVIVRDNNNCMVTVPVLISEPSLLQLTASPDIILDCYNDKNGSGTFNATGGTLPYAFTYQENTANATFAAPGFNSYSFFNAGAGVITVRVTDNNGCFEEATINLTQPPQLLPGSIEADQVLCAGDNPATITQVTPATGGPGEISYQWQYATDSLGTYFNIALAAGPAANEYTPPANAQSTLYYRRMATSGVCQPVYTDTIMIKVNPRPVAILSGGATICPGDSAVLKVEMPIGVPPFNIVIDNYGAISNYRSEDTIWVKPLATTTYTLQSVTDSNLCAITGPPNMMGSATVIVRDLATITTDPSDVVTCEYGMITFEVGATGSDLLYQWYVNDGNGFAAITDGGIYFGANTSKLYLFGATRNMDGYLYHAEVMTCSVPVTSADALLTVKTNPEIIHQPQDTTICSGGTAEFRISARGTGLTFRWQRNSGGGFTDITDNSNFSGSKDSVLVITDVPGTFNNNIFRVIIDGDCGITLQSNIVALRVNMPPAVNLNPIDQSVCDGSGPVYFVANGSGMIDSLRWQVNIGGAGTWEDIYDNSIYSGTTTQQLALVNIPLSYSTNQYRLALKAYCGTVYSNPATLTVNSNPVVSFASDTIFVCGGVDTPIDPDISGGSGSWSQHVWTGDIGPLSNYFVETPNFRSLLPVSYDLNYRVRDSNGCYGEGSVVVTVDSPDASFDQDLMTMCTPDTVTFTKDMTGIASFSWNFGDGSPLNTTDANPVHIFTNANASAIEYYNVTLTVVSDRGCSSSFTRMTTVYPAVDATFTASADTICSGSTVVFTAMSGASNYYWDYGDLVSGPGSYVATHLYQNTTTAPLTRTVSLITTSFYGCTDVKTVDIVVMPDPMPQFIAAPTPQIFNPAGNVVNFTNQTNAGTWNYFWRFGDGSTSTEENPSHTYTNVGTFNVTLIVDNISCRDSVTHQITILPIPPVANFDSIPSGCEPLYINLNNTSLNTETPGTTYRWDFGDGNYSTVKNPTYTYYNPGTYRVELTVTGPGGTSVKSQIVNVYVSPRAYFEVTPSLVFANDERVRCFNLTQFADSYLWEFGDGDTSRQKEPYHRYMEEGVYDITLWAYSNNGCSDVYVLSPGVTVEPAGEIRFSTVFTPNKEGPIERTDLPTGGTEIDQFFFPPIREKVTDYKLQIFNRLGVLIFESRDINVPWNGYYQGQLCPQGVYVWYVEGKYANGKPFKQAGDITLLH